ncbi:hypothetical protein CathTA2_0714 [Caldalkalibacillus thermarum TA2.A1]|uniref:Phage protein n=1 Tax=Caldalkalibacillus thermarum (strain TA2.A1) TaxID=986075 RepID=F5L4K1_CALTT|nr:hypothetical protein [Caldalkalibacillus thermarum]EGL83747.1 hypothetical protein CathTA2_0714 [Caldalkalibacillus thermarum TA2.A1]QZT33975.1 hypothetical protein HUR95_00600 [Caldalkalibacillus thermarum TA2.A1]
MQKKVMKRAVELARKMEGDWVARMALALRQAWKEAKQPKSVVYDVRHQPSGGREWVAEIVGRHPKYKLDRKFETPVERRWSSSGKTGRTYFELQEGRIYEINEPYRGRYFVKVENGEVVGITADAVLGSIA